VKAKVVIITEIIAPYRIPVFNALAQRPEIDLQLIFLSENDPALRQWMVYKDEIQFQYRVLPSWRQRFGKYHILLNRGVRSALNASPPDVIVCGGYNYLAAWAAAYWARARRIPFFLWTESTAMDRRRSYLAVELTKKYFLSLCTAFVVPGRSSLQYLKKLGVAERRIGIAPNAIDTALFSKLAEDARLNESEIRARRQLPERYFLFVGRLVKEKGIFDLLDAYAQLDAKIRAEIGLVFVGEGSQRRELMRRASKITPGSVQFSGFVHREELPAIYALAAGLTFPTHSDPWGLVVNEAMACGLPVITTNAAGCALDLVEEGWNGFVVPPNDRDRLAAAIQNLAADSDLRREMGRRSWERIQAYSPAAWAQGIVQIAQSVDAK
jgi:glycosyltransferase involved in cell wall biosynthesis